MYMNNELAHASSASHPRLNIHTPDMKPPVYLPPLVSIDTTTATNDTPRIIPKNPKNPHKHRLAYLNSVYPYQPFRQTQARRTLRRMTIISSSFCALSGSLSSSIGLSGIHKLR